jgi:hypothetical protein
MKKTIVSTLVCLVAAVSALAQGQVNFGNLAPASGVNAPVFLSDGITRLSGPVFQAELLAGPDAGSLTPRAATGFLTGGGAGYINGGTVTLAGIPGATAAFIQLRVWDTTKGATYALAQASGLNDAYGFSSVFSVITGNPAAVPPGTPANLVGLTSFNMQIVPEPSTFVLAGLGLASLLLFRRRK